MLATIKKAKLAGWGGQSYIPRRQGPLACEMKAKKEKDVKDYLESSTNALSVCVHGARLGSIADVTGGPAGPIGITTARTRPVPFCK